MLSVVRMHLMLTHQYPSTERCVLRCTRVGQVPPIRSWITSTLVILHGMTSRVGPKGQVVIPQQLRRQLDIKPGDEVEFWIDGDHVSVRPVGLRAPLRGRFADEPFITELERQRADDRDRENRR
jgi:AbrB family looped-hinge helix DNA binding protein